MIEALRAQVRALERGGGRRGGGPRAGALPFGVPAIDRALPEGGLALGSVHEVEGAGLDLEHGAAAALFVAAILARLEGPVVWCLTARDLFAPGLAGIGLDPARIIYAEARAASAVLPLVEEALRHPGLAGVVGEADRLGRIPSRRLQLAAESSGVTGFIIRRPRVSSAAKPEPNVAATRWRIAALPPASPPPRRFLSRRALTERQIWQLDLVRCRGGEPAGWAVTAPDASGHLTLAETVAEPVRSRAAS